MLGLGAPRAGRGGSGLHWKMSAKRAIFEAYVVAGGTSGNGDLGAAGGGKALLRIELAVVGCAMLGASVAGAGSALVGGVGDGFLGVGHGGSSCPHSWHMSGLESTYEMSESEGREVSRESESGTTKSLVT